MSTGPIGDGRTACTTRALLAVTVSAPGDRDAIPLTRRDDGWSAQRDRGLLEEVEGILPAFLRPGLDHGVPALLLKSGASSGSAC